MRRHHRIPHHPSRFMWRHYMFKRMFTHDTSSVRSRGPHYLPCCYLAVRTLPLSVFVFFKPQIDFVTKRIHAVASFHGTKLVFVLSPLSSHCNQSKNSCCFFALCITQSSTQREHLILADKSVCQKCSRSSHSTSLLRCWRVDAAAPLTTSNRKVFTVVL